MNSNLITIKEKIPFYLLLGSICLILFISCNKDKNIIDPDLIAGAWELQEVTCNQIDVMDINSGISINTILNIGDDNFYYRNYISGDWTLNNHTLELKPNESLNMSKREYEVLALSEDRLELQIPLTESQYGCDFDEFGILTIKETYIRKE